MEIFSLLQILWKKRNERLHGKSERDLEREKLNLQIRELQKKKFYVPPRLRRLYRQNPDDITASKKSIHDIRRWIRIFQLCSTSEYHHKKYRPPHTSDIRRLLSTNQIDPPQNSQNNIITKRKSRLQPQPPNKRTRTGYTLSLSNYFTVCPKL